MVTTLRTAAILFILVATMMSQNVALGETPLDCTFDKSMSIPVNWTEISGIWYLRNWMSSDSSYLLDASIANITYDFLEGLIRYRFNYSKPNTGQTCVGPSPIPFTASPNTAVVERGMPEFMVHTAVFSLLDEKTLAIWEELSFGMGLLRHQWLYVLTESPNSETANMNNSIFQNVHHCTQFNYSQRKEVDASHYATFICD